MNPIWITWENQRRNRELCQAFGFKLCELSQIEKIGNLFQKYLLGIIKTLFILYREKPKIVFCQNPSIVLSFLLIFVKLVTGIRVCIDTHNAGLFPREGKSRILNLIARYIQRKADLTIVTNESLRDYVEMNGGHAFVLPDKMPNITAGNPRKLKGKLNILFICTYSSDEPFQIVFDAARHIGPDIFIYVTGDHEKHAINTKTLPDNVILTGFIPEDEYQEMLNSVDITIDLTNRENCLVCGAYESVAVEKPMILSNSKALRKYFNMGAVYTDHTSESLRNAVDEVLKRKDELTEQIKELKKVRTAEWQERKKELDIFLKSFDSTE